MYYFAGVYNQKKNSSIKKNTIFMFSEENKKNSKLFLDDYFSVGYMKPEGDNIKEIASHLSTKDKNIKVFFEGRITNIEELEKKINNKALHKLIFANIVKEIYKKGDLELFSYLKGAYAFAIYDGEKDRIILHRDKSGNKSLYYGFKNGILVFGTLIKPILKSLVIKKEINLERIYNFFSLRSVSIGNDTEFKNIYNLLPGELIIVDKNKIFRKQLTPTPINNVFENEEETADKLYKIIKTGIESSFSIYKKAPIAFSGGLDTNIIINLASKNKIPINTFTLKFETKIKVKNIDYDLAKKRAKKHNANHRELVVTAKSYVKNIEEKIKSYDRLMQMSYLNNDCIFDFVSEYSDLVYTGDGVEEQLGFYPWVQMPYSADVLLENTHQDKEAMNKRLLKSTLNHFFNTANNNERFSRNSIFSSSFLNKIKSYYPSGYVDLCVSKIYNNNSSILNKIFYLAFHNILMPNKVNASDFIARKYSIEICAPYISEDYVNFLDNLPANLKYNGNGHSGSKIIFRKAVSRLIGEKDAFTTFKSGSNLPLSEWFLEASFEKFIRGVLSCKRVDKSGVLNPDEVKKIVNEHYNNRRFYDLPFAPALFKKGTDNLWQIINLVSFQLWWEENFDK